MANITLVKGLIPNGISWTNYDIFWERTPYGKDFLWKMKDYFIQIVDILMHHKVASSRPVYFSILETFV